MAKKDTSSEGSPQESGPRRYVPTGPVMRMVRVTPSVCDTTRLPSNGAGTLAVADPLDNSGLKGRPCSSTKMRLPPPHIAQTLLPSLPQVRHPSLPCGMAARPAHKSTAHRSRQHIRIWPGSGLQGRATFSQPHLLRKEPQRLGVSWTESTACRAYPLKPSNFRAKRSAIVRLQETNGPGT